MKTTGKPLRASPSASKGHPARSPLPAAPPESADRLKPAAVLLILVFVITVLPALLMTADHLVRQKPGFQYQQAVFGATGLTAPCFFPAAHPARTRLDNTSTIDWRLAPSLPRPVPGPLDLVGPQAVYRGGHDHGR